MPIPSLQLQKKPVLCTEVAASLWAADVHKMSLTPEQRFMCHVCLRNPFLPFLLRIPSIQPLPEAWAFWEPRTFCHLCIKSWLHHAHPFVAAAEKNLSHAERQRVWSRSCDLKEVLQVSNCWDWAFSISELDVWLPTFQLPMFAKCDALPKRDAFHMFV